MFRCFGAFQVRCLEDVDPDVIRQYQELFTELRYFSAVSYGFSDCASVFRMDRRLDEDARYLGRLAHAHGLHSCSLREYWASLEPFCVGVKGDRKKKDW